MTFSYPPVRGQLDGWIKNSSTLRLTLEIMKRQKWHTQVSETSDMWGYGQIKMWLKPDKQGSRCICLWQLTVSPQTLWPSLPLVLRNGNPWIARWGQKQHPLKLELSSLRWTKLIKQGFASGSLLPQNTSSKEINRYHVEKNCRGGFHAGLKKKKKLRKHLIAGSINTLSATATKEWTTFRAFLHGDWAVKF